MTMWTQPGVLVLMVLKEVKRESALRHAEGADLRSALREAEGRGAIPEALASVQAELTHLRFPLLSFMAALSRLDA